jgi:hypothetical protein
MTTVFIGGSRAVSRLNEVIRGQLDDLIQKNCRIFIGDANGADRAVQQHFADRGYGNVVVYCMDHCRNNVGNWQVRPISHPGGKRDFSYFAQKDLAMAREARCGVMFWDGKSKGTLNNIHNLLHEQKAVLVYLSPEKAFHKLTKESDLNDLLSRCDQEQVDRAQRQLQQSEATLHRRQMSLP